MYAGVSVARVLHSFLESPKELCRARRELAMADFLTRNGNPSALRRAARRFAVVDAIEFEIAGRLCVKEECLRRIGLSLSLALSVSSFYQHWIKILNCGCELISNLLAQGIIENSKSRIAPQKALNTVVV